MLTEKNPSDIKMSVDPMSVKSEGFFLYHVQSIPTVP